MGYETERRVQGFHEAHRRVNRRGPEEGEEGLPQPHQDDERDEEVRVHGRGDHGAALLLWHALLGFGAYHRLPDQVGALYDDALRAIESQVR